MNASASHDSYSYRLIVSRAWPIILANASAPLLGLADTAVIGRTGSVASLGAIALGSLILTFLYWTFGFLRMGTTGLVAQADGSGDEAELRAAVARSMLLGAVAGTGLILLQILLFRFALSLFSGSIEVETAAARYLQWRIWAAPATLSTYAIMGGLIGLGNSRTLLGVQLFLNSLNIVLDVLLAGYWGLGVAGIAIGTMIAEWTAAILAFCLIRRILKQRYGGAAPFWSWSRIAEMSSLRKTVSVHFNILIRTLCLLLGFGWFTRQGTKLGDVILAANHILLQFISFSAFFLDGFAYATEGLVGAAAGARRKEVFGMLVRRTGILAGVTSLILAAGFYIFGDTLIGALTDLDRVRLAAMEYLPFASFYILVSFVAFQLDGIFIGTTRTREMRNAALLSVSLYVLVDWFLTPRYGSTGLWLAMISFILFRAAALGFYYPRLRQAIG